MTKRRELLKKLSLAGAAGAVWKKPVVDSMVLPAHAQTSCINYYGTDVSPQFADTHFDSGVFELAMSSIVSNAHAQTQPGTRPIIEMSACVVEDTVTVLFTPSRTPASWWALYQSVLKTDGSPGTVTLGPNGLCEGGQPFPLGPEDGPQAVKIINYTLGDPNITIEIEGGTNNGSVVRAYTIPLAPGTAMPVSCSG